MPTSNGAATNQLESPVGPSQPTKHWLIHTMGPRTIAKLVKITTMSLGFMVVIAGVFHGVVNQLNYRSGAPHCRYSGLPEFSATIPNQPGAQTQEFTSNSYAAPFDGYHPSVPASVLVVHVVTDSHPFQTR